MRAFLPVEIDREQITTLVREQMRDHPVRSLTIAALGGLLVGTLLRRS